MDSLYTKVHVKCHNLTYRIKNSRRLPCNYVGEAFVLKEHLADGTAQIRCPDCGLFINNRTGRFIPR